jgi:murein DD-endopeptidase MepM/ murein hydrolase activator NlpD
MDARQGRYARPAAAAVLILAAAAVARLGRREPVYPQAPPIVVTHAHEGRSDTLRRNETLTHLFSRHNIQGAELFALLSAAKGLDPSRVRAGQVFEFRYAVSEGRPDRVVVRVGDERILTLRRDAADAWLGSSETIDWIVDVRLVKGEIASSLYETLEQGIPDSVLPGSQRAQLAWDLADGVFGWVIDFTRDVYEGDRFELLFERLASPFGDVRFGRIVAARIETRGRVNTAYVLSDAEGRNVYYDAAGRSLLRDFKLSPVPYRITSRFSRRRYHPVLKRYRPHLGADFGAPHGADVRATGDGVVARAGRWDGYGIMVALRHAHDVETRYAHLSAVAGGIRAGARVRQGDVVGYVGSTGLATGAHVHYEFLKNGRHLDPRSALRFGDGEPLPAERRAEFDSVRAYYDRLFQYVPPSRAAAGGD